LKSVSDIVLFYLTQIKLSKKEYLCFELKINLDNVNGRNVLSGQHFSLNYLILDELLIWIAVYFGTCALLLAVYFGMACLTFWHNFAHFRKE